MPPIIDARRLWSQLMSKYGGSEDRSPKHPVILIPVPGYAPITIRQQHSSRGDLPLHIAKQTAENLGVTLQELKTMEQCSFDRAALGERLRRVS